MATRMFEVQQKIFSAIDNNLELQEIVSGMYDYVPEDTPLPYITFGQILSSEDVTKTDEGEELVFSIESWSISKGRKELVKIITEIEKSLEEEIQLSSAQVIEQKVINREVIEYQYGLYHGSIQFKIRLVWD